MKKAIFIITFLTSMISIYGQNDKEKLAYNIVKEFLESDVYYIADYERSEIPKITIFCYGEKIPINYERFELNDNKLTQNFEQMDFAGLGVEKDASNYLLFHSDLIDNVLMVEILMNRPDYLNKPAKTAFETYKRFNGVMTYLFTFSDDGCLLSIRKERVSYQ